MTLFGDVAGNTALVREIAISSASFRKGSTAPTDAVLGATPEVPALLMDATNELVDIGVVLPINWDKGDIEVRLLYSLVNVQLNNDAMDLTCDYVATRFAGGAGPTKAHTNVAAQTLCVTGRLAVDDTYEAVFTMLAADATNPLANAVSIHGEIHLTNVTGVAAIHLIAGRVRYTATH